MDVQKTMMQELEKTARKKKWKQVCSMWAIIVLIIATASILIHFDLNRAPYAMIASIFGVTITAKLSNEKIRQVDVWQWQEREKIYNAAKQFGFHFDK